MNIQFYKDANNHFHVGRYIIPTGNVIADVISEEIISLQWIGKKEIKLDDINEFFAEREISTILREDNSPYEDVSTFLTENKDFFVNAAYKAALDIIDLNSKVNILEDKSMYKFINDNVRVSHTGTLVRTVIKSITIPENTLFLNSVIWFNIFESCTNNGNVKDIYLYINDIPVFNWGASSYAARQRYFDLRLKNGEAFIAGLEYSGSHVGMNINDSTYNIPFSKPIGTIVENNIITNEMVIELRCQLANIADTYRCESFHLIIEK